MSTPDYYDLQMPGSWGKVVAGHFVCNDGSDPTVASGIGYSVARDDTGDYTVSLTGNYGHMVSTVAGVQYAGAAGTGVVDVEVTGLNHQNSSFSVTTTSGGAAFDFGSDVAVHFVFVGRATTVRP